MAVSRQGSMRRRSPQVFEPINVPRYTVLAFNTVGRESVIFPHPLMVIMPNLLHAYYRSTGAFPGSLESFNALFQFSKVGLGGCPRNES